VSHTCNPSYSGARDQEDHCSKPAWICETLSKKKKKTHHKKGLVEWVKVKALSSISSTAKEKKRNSDLQFFYLVA
jgi:hypothetical protein